MAIAAAAIGGLVGGVVISVVWLAWYFSKNDSK
jgi:hypothetical protein